MHYNKAEVYDALFGNKLASSFAKKFSLFDNVGIVFADERDRNDATSLDLVRLYVKADIPPGPGFSGTRNASIASVQIGRLDTNCGVGVMSGMNVFARFHRHGIGSWLVEWCVKMMTQIGFTIAIATTNDTQRQMERLLPKYGWRPMQEMGFVNRRTGRQITFWRVILPSTEAASGVPMNVIDGRVV